MVGRMTVPGAGRWLGPLVAAGALFGPGAVGAAEPEATIAVDEPAREVAAEPVAETAAEPVSATAPAPEAEEGEPIYDHSTVGLGVALGFSQLAEMGGINQRLTTAGYGELPELGVHVAFSIPLSVERLIMLARIQMASVSNEDGNAALETYLGTFSAGYSITPPEILALYPFFGIGVGSAELSVGEPTPIVATFDQALGSSTGPVDLSTLAFLGTVGIGADLMLARTGGHPTRGLTIGLRAGYTAVFFDSDWSFGPTFGDVSENPNAPLSGVYGELAFGLQF